MSNYHNLALSKVFSHLQSTKAGLDSKEALRRSKKYGLNALPHTKVPGFWRIFLRQFFSPLIYILIFAAILSLALGHRLDAAFIAGVLIFNALIGTLLERGAEKAADSLKSITKTRANVIRDHKHITLDSEFIVPGDIIFLESGNRVPCDLRLVQTQGLEIDESLLTGESIPVTKSADTILEKQTGVADQTNMAFSGTMVIRGRATAIAIATGLSTELGKIAHQVMKPNEAVAPLLIRMKKFTQTLAYVFIGISILLGVVYYLQGAELNEVLLLSAALGVSVIPEGLPIALTIALAVAMNRMSRKKVIARNLTAVESLGSCTVIASDKTGTLTVNEMTVKKICFPNTLDWEVTGEGYEPNGEILYPEDKREHLNRALRTATLCNEGKLYREEKKWIYSGDPVDVALLVAAKKAGITNDTYADINIVAQIPYEPQLGFSAIAIQDGKKVRIHVKGAFEKILTMCSHSIDIINQSKESLVPTETIKKQAAQLGDAAYRVLALADGEILLNNESLSSFDLQSHLKDLTFICLLGMNDPLRPDAATAIHNAHQAGIHVKMITGDHPSTAFTIAKELNLTNQIDQVITGKEINEAIKSGQNAMTQLIQKGTVFARVNPQNKIDIVNTLIRNGEFVAVTGDGVNDAPALRAAHLGIAMGQSGTDVARETSDLILTNDDFSSIIAGIEEGRIAYSNVRKVVFLLLSTGAAEIILFILSILFGLPIPLTAIQLLWLNLVTEGVQDIALAFEPGEGDELNRPPRPPKEPIFNRIMIERCLITSLIGGGSAFLWFKWMIAEGVSIENARNLIMLYFVLFENITIGISRSEVHSSFSLSPFRNPLLLSAAIGANVLHLVAIQTPIFSDILDGSPITVKNWMTALAFSLPVVIFHEIYIYLKDHFNKRGSEA
ncbi:MAG: ATPase [Bdellovibrionaceae bacterium]|nr:ATPase [Pseudobdellovibrionaceae bacterium]|tara:strand:- start:3124 stop:5823 length:2700 start_codon:yes stop_codon:yes gene_type:complete